MTANAQYEAKQFNLGGFYGISDRTLEMHFKLYEGYVKETIGDYPRLIICVVSIR